jgi:hypothetical protein
MKTVLVEKEHLIFKKYHFVAAIRWRKLFVLDFKKCNDSISSDISKIMNE